MLLKADGLPWLYYTETPQALIKDKNIDLTVSFYSDPSDASRVMSLTYYLARYAMDGTFRGFQQLKTQRSLCPMTYKDV